LLPVSAKTANSSYEKRIAAKDSWGAKETIPGDDQKAFAKVISKNRGIR
jgi:hypothetical protein